MKGTRGKVAAVNGNMVAVEFDGPVMMNEVAYVSVDNTKLKGEVIRIKGNTCSLQVFEMTKGLSVGDAVEFSGNMLSIELGPGLLTQVFDGLQNPLPQLAQKCGFFLERGEYLEPLPLDKEWAFTPKVKPGDTLVRADTIGTVPEGVFSTGSWFPLTCIRPIQSNPSSLPEITRFMTR